MQNSFLPQHSSTIIDIIIAIASLGWLVVGLKINNLLGVIRLAQLKDKQELIQQQYTVKAELIAGQVANKEDLVAQTNQFSQKFAVHVAEDLINFNQITSNQKETHVALAKMDTKLDSLAMIALAGKGNSSSV